MHLTAVLLKDMAPQRSCKETKEKPQERQGVDWTSWVFIITELGRPQRLQEAGLVSHLLSALQSIAEPRYVILSELFTHCEHFC